MLSQGCGQRAPLLRQSSLIVKKINLDLDQEVDTQEEEQGDVPLRTPLHPTRRRFSYAPATRSRNRFIAHRALGIGVIEGLLHVAVTNGDAELVRYLLEEGADVRTGAFACTEKLQFFIRD